MFSKLKRSNSDDGVIREIAVEPSSNLEKYLEHYVGLTNPGYAVLVIGDWGTGKTHQVRKALPDTHAVYVSLFGLKTSDEIEAQILAAMFPGRQALKKLITELDLASLNLGPLGNIGTGGALSALGKYFAKILISNKKTIIFDDLERCRASIGVTLGVISRYLDQHGCRLVVIAHDEKIQSAFNESKEKVIGQTIKITPDSKSAFDRFRGELLKNSPEKRLSELAIIRDAEEIVFKIFQDSGISSLRILRHLLKNIRRLISCLSFEQKREKRAFATAIKLFAVFSIFARAGQLSQRDLLNRNPYSLVDIKNGASVGIMEVQRKYPEIELHDTTLSNATLCEMIFNGHFEPTAIQEDVSRSPYLFSLNDYPSWLFLINWRSLSDKDLEEATTRLHGDFSQFKLVDPGEILHSIAVRMFMAEKNVLPSSVRGEEEHGKKYIDDLLNLKKLPARTGGLDWDAPFARSYRGYTYYCEESYKENFKSVLEHLSKRMTDAFYQKKEEHIHLILDHVTHDPERLFSNLVNNRSGKTFFGNIAILNEIPTGEFVDAWLSSENANWRTIERALTERAKGAYRDPALEPERAWFVELTNELDRRSTSIERFAKIRIQEVITSLKQVVNSLSEQSS